MWQCGSTASLRSRTSRQLSGVQPSEASKNAVVNWQSHIVSFLGCAMYNLHRVRSEGETHQYSLLNWVIGAFGGRNRNDNGRQCMVSQDTQNNGQIGQVKLWAASPSTILSRYSPQRLLSLCWFQKDVPGKNVCYNIFAAHWSPFWSQIFLQD